jgi:hypothetical protein
VDNGNPFLSSLGAASQRHRNPRLRQCAAAIDHGRRAGLSFLIRPDFLEFRLNEAARAAEANACRTQKSAGAGRWEKTPEIIDAIEVILEHDAA